MEYVTPSEIATALLYFSKEIFGDGDNELEFLGQGEFGEAYATQNHVIKVTSSWTEALNALITQYYQHPDSAIARIDKVVKLPEHGSNMRYVIIQERVTTHGCIAEQIQTLLSTVCCESEHNDLEDWVEQYVAHYGKVPGEDDKGLLYLLWDAWHEPGMLGLSGTDIHAENIGVAEHTRDKLRVVLFDQMNYKLEQQFPEQPLNEWTDPEVFALMDEIETNFIKQSCYAPEVCEAIQDAIYESSPEEMVEVLIKSVDDYDGEIASQVLRSFIAEELFNWPGLSEEAQDSARRLTTPSTLAEAGRYLIEKMKFPAVSEVQVMPLLKVG